MPDVQVNGFSLHYETAGEGPAVLFSHSLVCDREMFAAQAEGLADEFFTINVDTRGHGRSGYPSHENWTIEEMVEDFIPLLDELQVDKVHWVGLSLGGMLGLRLALKYPERVASLTLMDTTAQGEVPALQQAYLGLAQAVRAGMIDQVMDKLINLFFAPTTQQQKPELVAHWKEKFRQLDVEGVYRAALATFQRSDLSADLGKITIPALVMRGALDQARLPAESDFMVQNLPNARLEVIPDAAHLAALEQPEFTNQKLREFLHSVVKG